MFEKYFEKAITDFIKQFQSNSFRYFYEEDLRAALAINLSNLFDEIKYKVRADFAKILEVDEICSNPIKCEYPQSGKKNKKFDIVYIEDVGSDFYNCEIRIAIELKLGSLIYDRLGKFKEDIEKLEKRLAESNKSEFLGIGLYFYQGEIDLRYVKEWFPEASKEIRQISKTSFEKIHLNSYGLNIFIISKSSLFILPV